MDTKAPRQELSGSKTRPIRPFTSGRRRLIFILLSIAVSILGFRFLTSDSTGIEYYKHVDEVFQNPGQWQKKSMQIHGFVTANSIRRSFDEQTKRVLYSFEVENCGKHLYTEFYGIVPDTFQEGAEVVIKGKLSPTNNGNWQIIASEVLGKCPSKYSQDSKHIAERNERCIQDQRGP